MCYTLHVFMPKCRYCHESISRLDKDICPFCGGKKPLEGVDDSTIDITKVFDPTLLKQQKLEPRSKVCTGILSILLGIFGIDELYIYRFKRALITLVITLLFVGGLGSILFFFALKNVFGFLIPYFVLEFYFIFKGIYIFVSPTIKDGRGEFLK